MSKLIIFVIETKSSKYDSDGVYVKEVYQRFYSYNKYDTIFRFVYMDGKWNYNKKNVLNKINGEIKKFLSVGNKDYHVVYIADKDEYRTNQQDEKYVRMLTQFCKEKGYKLVWMDKNIEDVFLGHSVEQNQKIKEAARFKRDGLINHIPTKNLMDRECCRQHCSHILCVLNLCFDEKNKNF